MATDLRQQPVIAVPIPETEKTQSTPSAPQPVETLKRTASPTLQELPNTMIGSVWMAMHEPTPKTKLKARALLR